MWVSVRSISTQRHSKSRRGNTYYRHTGKEREKRRKRGKRGIREWGQRGKTNKEKHNERGGKRENCFFNIFFLKKGINSRLQKY